MVFQSLCREVSEIEAEGKEKAGIIADKSRPQDLITRAEAAAMVIRAHK